MYDQANWLEVSSRFAEVLLPFGTFLLGKAMKGGSNQVLLDQATAEIKDLKKTILDHSITLAAHTVLHTQYALSIDHTNRALNKIEESDKERAELLYKICGKLGIDL